MRWKYSGLTLFLLIGRLLAQQGYNYPSPTQQFPEGPDKGKSNYPQDDQGLIDNAGRKTQENYPGRGQIGYPAKTRPSPGPESKKPTGYPGRGRQETGPIGDQATNYPGQQQAGYSGQRSQQPGQLGEQGQSGYPAGSKQEAGQTGNRGYPATDRQFGDQAGYPGRRPQQPEQPRDRELPGGYPGGNKQEAEQGYPARQGQGTGQVGYPERKPQQPEQLGKQGPIGYPGGNGRKTGQPGNQGYPGSQRQFGDKKQTSYPSTDRQLGDESQVGYPGRRPQPGQSTDRELPGGYPGGNRQFGNQGYLGSQRQGSGQFGDQKQTGYPGREGQLGDQNGRKQPAQFSGDQGQTGYPGRDDGIPTGPQFSPGTGYPAGLSSNKKQPAKGTPGARDSFEATNPNYPAEPDSRRKYPGYPEESATENYPGQRRPDSRAPGPGAEAEEGDFSAIPGQPDVDYPIYADVPATSFRCTDQPHSGYYADVEARCQAFHVCAGNRTYDFLCPNGTVFHQEFLVCVWWNLFDCDSAPGLFRVNGDIFAGIGPGAADGAFVGSSRYPGSRGDDGYSGSRGDDGYSGGDSGYTPGPGGSFGGSSRYPGSRGDDGYSGGDSRYAPGPGGAVGGDGRGYLPPYP